MIGSPYLLPPAAAFYLEQIERDLDKTQHYDCGSECANEFVDRIVYASKEGEITVRNTRSLLRQLTRRLLHPRPEQSQHTVV